MIIAVMLGTITIGLWINTGSCKHTFIQFTVCTFTRMKWKPIEPNQGDFITEVADNMIAWAQSNNITVRG